MIATLLQPGTWRAVAAQLARLIIVLLTVSVWSIGVTAAAVAIQAQRDETRSADLLLVVTPDVVPTSLIEHSLDLFRRGYGPQMALIGPGRERAAADLLGRGLPPEALADLAGYPTTIGTLNAAQSAGARSLLIISVPADQLLSLKIARDVGMRAYGSPVPGTALAPLDTLRAALGYWRYALINS